MPNKPTDIEDVLEPSAAAIAEIMQQRLSKNPALAAKQARLLAMLGASPAHDTNELETEADGPRAGALRLLKVQRQAQALRDKTSKKDGIK